MHKYENLKKTKDLPRPDMKDVCKFTAKEAIATIYQQCPPQKKEEKPLNPTTDAD
jgi:hypothetical protein